MQLDAKASQASEAFRDKLLSACLKIDAKDICQCYSKAVTARYGDQQLAAIAQLLQDRKANQMFVVVHATEAKACKSQVERG